MSQEVERKVDAGMGKFYPKLAEIMKHSVTTATPRSGSGKKKSASSRMTPRGSTRFDSSGSSSSLSSSDVVVAVEEDESAPVYFWDIVSA